jgi:hypothetical protein
MSKIFGKKDYFKSPPNKKMENFKMIKAPYVSTALISNISIIKNFFKAR